MQPSGRGAYKSGSKNQVLGLCDAAILGADDPLAAGSVKVAADDDGVEGGILLDPDNLVDVLKIGTEVLVVGIVVGPVPGFPDLRPGELILRDLGVDAGAGVAVPAPGAAQAVASLEDGRLQTAISECLEHEDAS